MVISRSTTQAGIDYYRWAYGIDFSVPDNCDLHIRKLAADEGYNELSDNLVLDVLTGKRIDLEPDDEHK